MERGGHLGRALALVVAGLWPALALALEPYSVLHGTVARVVDGDTLRLSSGQTVRLLDINTPELAHDGRPAQPLAEQAKAGLGAMVLGQSVTLQLGARVYDPYERVLAHVFLNPSHTTAPRWVNGGMVAAGLAHVYTFPDNRVYGPQLLALEDAARSGHKGLWALPAWQIRDAQTCCAEADMGRFVVVEGVVQAVARVGERTYLNFGPDWRTDFSVAVEKRNEKFFKPKPPKGEAKGDKKAKKPKAQAINWADYVGQRVRVRGIATPVNGTLVKVTHPEQIQRLGAR